MDGSFAFKDDDSNSSSSSGGAGDGHFPSEQEEPACVPPGHATGASPPSPRLPATASPKPPHTQFNPTSTAPTPLTATATTSSSSPKRSGRRSVHKRVVSIPISEADGSRAKGCGEGAPPSDSWAWRKYGQKPIKGSPYPRGYYRCSSSKGCPARKQVERSRVDPTVLVVTYACEHNHPWPLPKNHNHQKQAHHQKPSPAVATPPSRNPERETDAPALPAPAVTSSPASTDLEERFATDLLGDEPSLAMMSDEFTWFSDVSASSPPAETFFSADDVAMMPLAMDDDVEISGGDGAGDEESLFAGLGELPECAVVFRRGFLERQLRVQMEVEDERRRVAAAAAAPCCGGTG